ncbi:MAG: HAD-IA family hydrolase, partial [Cyanobacteria bacterium J06555_13]
MKNSNYKQQPSRSRVYSFDVFDTCVTRCWHQPTDLFEGLFLALLAEQNFPSPQRETAAKALARSRIQAERTTRKQTTADDITLDAIYQTLAPQLKAYNISPGQSLTAEIALELSSVSPILSTRQYIQQLRPQGYKVLFISDMYLPGSVVRQMLMDHGFTDGSDEVFVSADVGLSKGSGKLFSAVCKQLNISPKQLHHTGDNSYADVRSARRMGVKATYFAQGDPTRYEQGFRPELMGSDWVRSQIIGNSRAVRLRHATADKYQRQHAMLAANLLAPLLTGYVAWVLTTAQAMRLEHLYFENEGLLAIAQTLQQQWHKRCASEHQIDQETA